MHLEIFMIWYIWKYGINTKIHVGCGIKNLIKVHVVICIQYFCCTNVISFVGEETLMHVNLWGLWTMYHVLSGKWYCVFVLYFIYCMYSVNEKDVRDTYFKNLWKCHRISSDFIFCHMPTLCSVVIYIQISTSQVIETLYKYIRYGGCQPQDYYEH